MMLRMIMIGGCSEGGWWGDEYGHAGGGGEVMEMVRRNIAYA